VFEFDGPMCATNLGHESRTVPRLYIWLPSKIGRKHDEIIRNNRIEFIVSPRLTDLFFVGH